MKGHKLSRQNQRLDKRWMRIAQFSEFFVYIQMISKAKVDAS